MNNNSIKNNEMEENIENQLTNQLTKVFFDLEESEIIEVKKYLERDWVDEKEKRGFFLC